MQIICLYSVVMLTKYLTDYLTILVIKFESINRLIRSVASLDYVCILTSNVISYPHTLSYIMYKRKVIKVLHPIPLGIINYNGRTFSVFRSTEFQ